MKTGRSVLAHAFVVAVILYLPLSGGMSANAQGKGACAGDVQTFCSTVQPGQGKIVQCLKQNIESLSQGCKDRILEVAEQVAGANQACEDDIFTFCPGVQSGGGQVAQCLKANQALLSPQCAAAMSQVGD
jgi:cysteine rich repeat protein